MQTLLSHDHCLESAFWEHWKQQSNKALREKKCFMKWYVPPWLNRKNIININLVKGRLDYHCLFKAPGSTANSPWRKRQRRQFPAFQQLLILDPVPSCGSHAGWLAAALHDENEICDNLMMIISCFIQTSEISSRLTSSWLMAAAHFHTGLLLSTHLNTLLSLLKTFKLYNTNSLKMSTRVFLTCLSTFQLRHVSTKVYPKNTQFTIKHIFTLSFWQMLCGIAEHKQWRRQPYSTRRVRATHCTDTKDFSQSQSLLHLC